MKITVSELRDLIGAVAQWSASVKSAANADERALEVERLKGAAWELRISAHGKKLKTCDLERMTSVLLEADRLIETGKRGQNVEGTCEDSVACSVRSEDPGRD